MTPKPGYLTTEFWTAAGTQLLALLALVGIINSGEAGPLGDAVTKCVTAAGVFLANAWVIVRYIETRLSLKHLAART